MITHEVVLRIAEEEIRVRGLGTGVRHVYLWNDIPFRKPSVYGPDLSNCWIAYVERPLRGLESSVIVAIDRDSGAVVCAGGANDEG
jgi:hypothetical protein